MREDELQDAFLLAMRRLAATVSVITCRDGEGRRYGMTATAVTSLSLTPASLLVCVNRSTDFYQRLARADAFCVNVLSESQAEQCRVFGSRRHQDERFKVGEWHTTVSGAPRLLTALAVFDCEVVHRITYGTHTIFLGEVHDVHIAGADDVEPLLYMDRAFMQLKKFETVQLS